MAPETPRGVSSRLLSMRFMQRAAASGSSDVSPASDAPSSKKRKLEHSPAEGRIDTDISQASIQAALDEREAKRLAALSQHSSSETHWVLKTKLDGSTTSKATNAPLNVVYIGYGDIDSDESGDDADASLKGRTSTGNYKNPKPERQNKTAKNDSSDDDSSEESSEDGDHSSPAQKPYGDGTPSKPAQGRSRSTSRSRQRNEDTKAKEFRDKRKKKEVPLNKLLSISSAGDGNFGSQGSPGSKSITCYTCQQVGHRASDCPKKGSRGARKRP